MCAFLCVLCSCSCNRVCRVAVCGMRLGIIRIDINAFLFTRMAIDGRPFLFAFVVFFVACCIC